MPAAADKEPRLTTSAHPLLLLPAPFNNKQISEGNSFRREQRERYGAPFRNMTSLAHATEDELLAAAEVQALQDDAVEKAMSEAIALHHHFLENATNR